VGYADAKKLLFLQARFPGKRYIEHYRGAPGRNEAKSSTTNRLERRSRHDGVRQKPIKGNKWRKLK
jgi:hypothetical protein